MTQDGLDGFVRNSEPVQVRTEATAKCVPPAPFHFCSRDTQLSTNYPESQIVQIERLTIRRRKDVSAFRDGTLAVGLEHSCEEGQQRDRGASRPGFRFTHMLTPDGSCYTDLLRNLPSGARE